MGKTLMTVSSPSMSPKNGPVDPETQWCKKRQASMRRMRAPSSGASTWHAVLGAEVPVHRIPNSRPSNGQPQAIKLVNL